MRRPPAPSLPRAERPALRHWGWAIAIFFLFSTLMSTIGKFI